MTKYLNKLAGPSVPLETMPYIQQKFNTDDREQPDNMPIYNVLLLGQAQSGKSTLLEAIKQYGNPSHVPDLGRIGLGNKAHTEEPYIEEIVTCLPSYRVFETNRHVRQEIEVEPYLQARKFKDFKSLLKRSDLEVMSESNTSFARFRIIDTPGLDDTEGRDVEYLGRIFSAISSLSHLHLVVITDSPGAIFAPGYLTALDTYAKVFSTMHGLMTLVTTKLPYKEQHPGRTDTPLFDAKLEQRAKIISGIMGRRFPSFKIDCNFQKNQPFHICLTRNTIRDILNTATIKTPVALKMRVQKTPVMKAVDQIVFDDYQIYIADLQHKCKLLDLADQLRLEIIQIESDIATKHKELQPIDTDELLHLYEVRFLQDWEHLYVIRPTKLRYSTYDYSIGASSAQYSAVEILTNQIEDSGETVEKIEEKGREEDGFVIDDIRCTQSAVEIMKESGGKGHRYWSVLFRRKSYEKGKYHAILSIRSRNKHRALIDRLKQEIKKLEEELEERKRLRTERLIELKLQGIPETTAVDPKAFQSLNDRLSFYRAMMDATKGWSLGLESFIERAVSGIYRGGPGKSCSVALEQFLSDKIGFDPKNHSTYRGLK
ncbi:hypothetical protein BGZ83_004557 [Gryganskiella cystojenkinii]|nr:hypothetical protein BGZ83_004557 [Gryganskiella cystojenkinii]